MVPSCLRAAWRARSLWTGRFVHSSRPAASPDIKPILEVLEDRTVPTDVVTFHGGSVLTSAQVININAAPADDAVTQLAPKLYNAGLQQYGAGIAGLAASFSAPPISGGGVSNAQVFTALSAFIAAHPPTTGQELYVWYLSPGQELTDANVRGWHSTLTVNGQTAIVAVVTDQSTYVGTHEILEAVTDPVLGTGWFAGDSFHEIGDIGSWMMWGGYSVCVPANRDGTLFALPPSPTPQPVPQPVPPLNPLVAWEQAWEAEVDALWADVRAMEQALLNWELALLAPYWNAVQARVV